MVAHLRDHKLVKGYVLSLPVKTLDDLVKQEPVTLPRTLIVRSEPSQRQVRIRLASLKALFFVKSFEGRKDFKEVKFFETYPPIEGLWVRLHFFDKEFTEGVVRNCLDLLMNPGFYLKPPDPQSNNEVIYVVKASLVDFKVLGVTSSY